MRVVVLGLGAIGGTIAAALTRSGFDAVGIARGAHLDVIRADGLRLRAPGVDERIRFDCVAAPSDLTFGPDDAILIATKTQDTLDALDTLRAAGVQDQPVFCLQNGVANERMALRRFANVHGVTVMMPATYMIPGEVAVFGQPCFGMFDIGRYPGGSDAADSDLAEMLDKSGFAGFVSDDVMAAKYGKLLMNLNNILHAALGPGTERGDLPARIKSEAIAAYEAAGIDWRDVGAGDPRRDELMQLVDLPGLKRTGGSTYQSLARGQSLETDYMNGEIALLGRLYGVPVPVNAGLCALAAELASAKAEPGSLTLADLRTRIGI